MNDMQQTSMEAWFKDAKPAAGKNQMVIYNLLKEHSALCNRDIQELLNWQPNSVTGRVHELREAEMVIESHRAKHPVSGRTVIYWKAAK